MAAVILAIIFRIIYLYLLQVIFTDGLIPYGIPVICGNTGIGINRIYTVSNIAIRLPIVIRHRGAFMPISRIKCSDVFFVLRSIRSVNNAGSGRAEGRFFYKLGGKRSKTRTVYADAAADNRGVGINFPAGHGEFSLV